MADSKDTSSGQGSSGATQDDQHTRNIELFEASVSGRMPEISRVGQFGYEFSVAPGAAEYSRTENMRRAMSIDLAKRENVLLNAQVPLLNPIERRRATIAPIAMPTVISPSFVIQKDENSSRFKRKDIIFLVLCVIVLPLVGTLVPVNAASRGLLVITVFVVMCWMMKPFGMPGPWAGLFLLLALPAANIVSFAKAWEGGSSTALWLIFSGMGIAVALRKTPLQTRLVRFLVTKSPTKFMLLLQAVAVGALMAIFVPSSVVRVVIVSPLARTVLKLLSVDPKKPTKESAALQLALAFTTVNSGSGILTATAPNLIMLHGVQTNGRTDIGWGTYASKMIFSMWLLQAAVIFGAIWLVFGRRSDCFDNYDERIELVRRAENKVPMQDRGRSSSAADESTPPATMEADERNTLVVLALCVLMWATDSLHHIQAVYIGLATVLILTFPTFGPLSFTDMRSVNFPALILMTSVIGLGGAFAHDHDIRTGISTPLVDFITEHASSEFGRYYLTVVVCVPVLWVMGTSATAGFASALLVKVHTELGLDPELIGLCVACSMGAVWLPYQCSPYLIAQSFNMFTVPDFAKVAGLVTIINFAVLIPLTIAIWLA